MTETEYNSLTDLQLAIEFIRSCRLFYNIYLYKVMRERGMQDVIDNCYYTEQNVYNYMKKRHINVCHT